MTMKALAVFLFACIALTTAQVVTLGGCPKSVKAMTDFKRADFLNTWYNQESYFSIFEFGGSCTTAEYTLIEDGKIKVANRQISGLTGKEQTIEGTATYDKNSTDAKLTVTFPTGPFKASAPYWVLDTDYTSYAVVWICYDLKALHSENAYLMTRDRNPSQEVLDKAYAAAKKSGINTDRFIANDQKDCK